MPPQGARFIDSCDADARLCGSNFTGADLTYAALPCNPAMTQGCVMRSAILRYCHLPVQVVASFHVDLYGVNFSGLNLTGANFSRLNISSSKFEKCILDDADFTECTAGWPRQCSLRLMCCETPDTPLPAPLLSSHLQSTAASIKHNSSSAISTMQICEIVTFLRANLRGHSWEEHA